MIREITRQELIVAIDVGIKNAALVLTDAEKALLRHVGRTEQHVLLLAWQQHVDGIGLCGCPLTQAGIVQIENGIEPAGWQRTKYQKFWHAFDKHVRMRQGPLSRALRIRD